MVDSKMSGSSERGVVAFLSRVLFENRVLVLVAFAGLIILVGWLVGKVWPEANFLRMIPTYHLYIKNFLK